MPVRSIPKNHVSVTGRHSTDKSIGDADFESPLENDYLILLDFDPEVERYEVQPVRVPVPGVPRGYVPDVLVHFRPDPCGAQRASELTEVKAKDDYERNAADYAAKFAAAEGYARSRGWKFVRKSDEDIRTPRLKNLKFLRAYRRIDPGTDDVRRLLDALGRLGGHSNVAELLDRASGSEAQRARALPVLWYLVLNQRIELDWDVAIAAETPLWLPGASG